MKNKAIEWGWESPKPSNMRSKEHQAFLINQYNAGKPLAKHVKSMNELNLALKNEV